MSGILNMSVAAGVKEGGKFLEPGIKKAVFKGVKIGSVVGKENGITYKTLEMIFDVEGFGEYSHKLFEPTSADRTTTDFNGNIVTNASQVEVFMLGCRHLLDAANPVAAKGIDEGTTVITGNFETIVSQIQALTAGFVGQTTEVKFLPQNNGYASMPTGYTAAKVNKSGQLYLPTRYIGTGLTLSANELKKIQDAQNARNATPTPMANPLGNMGQDFKAASGEIDDLPF